MRGHAESLLMAARESIIPIERIASRIYLIRGQKVMLDSDLAELYAVPTGRLNEQVKRVSQPPCRRRRRRGAAEVPLSGQLPQLS
ncbi:MAG: ORF6N domain-containing protein, partial [Isosphaeraceae bacterium]